MAGVKITDLETLLEAASDDLLYIVDVNDNTESPQGTSKKIQVQNIATAIGLESGSYTPTISGYVNGIGASLNAATYIRVGNVATVSVQLEITMDFGETTGAFEIELPVASNFTTIKQCFGLMQWSYNGTLAEIVGLSIGAETTNNTCLVDITTANAEAAMPYCTIQFQYEIL
jgi:hypothetical protein